MTRIVRAFAAALALVLPSAARAQAGNEAFVVSPAWLAEHLNDPKVVVLHVGFNRQDYRSGHIPGSRFVWTGWYAPSNPDLSTELAPVATLDSLFEGLGISDDSRIVIYGPPTFAARLFVTLDHLGAGNRTGILDGGLTAWKAEGRPVSTETSSIAKGSFTPRVQGKVVDAAFVSANLSTPGLKILDARTPEFYTGTGGGGPRPGHVQGAANIPFNTLTNEQGKFKDKAALADLFKAAGLEPGSRVVTYCHVGQQASLLYFVARYLGYDPKLYDGSFEDWSPRTELPVVK